KRVFLVILFTSFSGSLVSRIPGAVQATSAVYSHIRGENRSEQARKHAQQTFGETIGKSFDDAVARFSFPAWMLQLLRKTRDRIIHLLITLWERLF
ncbi:hypothetical protein QP337_21690, partial [Escherichia coli]|nr:hypothetical protein [Escherichia coli]